MSAVACPSAEQLSKFVKAGLSASSMETVKTHVERCPLCRHSVNVLAQLSEPLPSQQGVERGPTSGTMGKGDAHGPPSFSSPGARPGRLGPYELIAEAGQGGMGVVYKARHTLLDRLDAVKVLPQHRTSDGEAVKRFLREMKVVGQLSHPNLIQARYADQIDGTWLLVMDWVDGETLTQRVQRDGPMTPSEACDAAIQAAQGLAAAHERGIVHRDVKPSNLMRTSTGAIKVLDLGLARLRGDVVPVGGDATGSGMILGTADYIAPEQVGDARHADHRADIYSLGCTLYYLLSGRPPFPEPNTLKKLLAHQQLEPEPLSRLCRNLPEGLSRVVSLMMAKDINARTQTMTEVVAALRPFLNAPVATPPATDDTSLFRRQVVAEIELEEARTTSMPARRRIGPAIVVGSMALLVLVVLLAAWLMPPREKSGTVLVELMEQDVEVLVDGTLVPVEAMKAGPVELPEGEHAIVVRRGAETLFSRSIALGAGDREVLRATWKAKEKVVPSLFDRLDASKIPEKERFAWQPSGLVAVFGAHLNDGKPMSVLRSVALSADGRLLAGSGGANATQPIRVWDVESGRELRSFRMRDTVSVGALSFSPDGKRLLATAWHDHPRIWNVETGAEICKLGPGEQNLTHVVMDSAFLSDGKRVVTSHRDRHDGPCTLKVWDAEKGNQLKAMSGHTRYVNRIAVAADGPRVLSASEDRSLRLWDADNGEKVWMTELKQGASIPALSPCGGLAASTPNQVGPIQLWTMAGDVLTPDREIGGAQASADVASLAFSPDGTRLAAGSSEGRLQVWECASGKRLHDLKWTGSITCLVWSPDGRHIVTANNNGTAYVVRLPR